MTPLRPARGELWICHCGDRRWVGRVVMVVRPFASRGGSCEDVVVRPIGRGRSDDLFWTRKLFLSDWRRVMPEVEVFRASR